MLRNFVQLPYIIPTKRSFLTFVRRYSKFSFFTGLPHMIISFREDKSVFRPAKIVRLKNKNVLDNKLH